MTDFGMARLGDQNPRATRLMFTMCPGTDVYMPPEAVLERPAYTQQKLIASRLVSLLSRL